MILKFTNLYLPATMSLMGLSSIRNWRCNSKAFILQRKLTHAETSSNRCYQFCYIKNRDTVVIRNRNYFVELTIYNVDVLIFMPISGYTNALLQGSKTPEFVNFSQSFKVLLIEEKQKKIPISFSSINFSYNMRNSWGWHYPSGRSSSGGQEETAAWPK